MSATNFLDNVLERNGDYAVYGKALGDKMRQGVEYGSNPWPKAQEAIPGITGANDPSLEDRTNRIAELDKKIADLKNRIANWDGEGAIARYRFVYENDPSIYTQRFQSERSHKHALDLQKESQKKTDVQQKMDAWKQNSIDMDNARYSVAHWQQQLTAAKNAHDTKAYDNAKIELDRANAAYRRALRNNESLQKQVGSIFGFPQEPENPAKETVQGGEVDQDRVAMENFNAMKNELDLIDASVDNMPVDKKAKAQFIAEKNAQIDEAEKRIRSSDMLEADKNGLLKLAAEKRKALKDYSKPQGKGGQGTKMEPGDWAKSVDRKNADGGWWTAEQIVKKYSLAYIIKAIEDGAQNPNMERAKALASRKK